MSSKEDQKNRNHISLAEFNKYWQRFKEFVNLSPETVAEVESKLQKTVREL